MIDKTVLVIVDPQYDFMPGGALGVSDGFSIVAPIIDFARNNKIEKVAFTSDWHPEDHCSFSDNPKFEDMSWPPHCIQNQRASMIESGLATAFSHAPVFFKGQDPNKEQYSGFKGVSEDGQSLYDWLLGPEVDDDFPEYPDLVVVAGLALDYCVHATAIDLKYNDFDEVAVLVDGTRPVSYETGIVAAADLAQEGVIVATSEHLTRLAN